MTEHTYTVTGSHPNGNHYIKFIRAASPERACAHAIANGLRVKDVKPTLLSTPRLTDYGYSIERAA